VAALVMAVDLMERNRHAVEPSYQMFVLGGGA